MVEQIWQEFHQKLLNFINSQVSDTHIAEDILQEAFIKINNNIATLKEPEKLSAWLYQICRSTVIDYHRKRKISYDEIDLDSIEQVSSTNTTREQLNLCIEILINDLDVIYKEILISHEINGLKHSEISKQFNLSLPAVKSRIKRGKAQLKSKLSHCCDFEFSEIGVSKECKNDCGCN